MSVNRNTYFYLLSAGTIMFLFILLSEFSFNTGLISNYSIVLLFVSLMLLLIVLIFYSNRYVKRFKDRRDKVLLGIVLFSGAAYLFFLIINLLVML